MDELIFERNNIDFTNPSGYSFIKARKHIGICNNTNLKKVMLYGSKCIDLINHISIKKFSNDKERSINTVIMKKNRFICEANIYKISALRYLITSQDIKKLLIYLAKIKRKFPLVTISEVTNKYSIFTFHGNSSNYFFENISSNNLYKLNHQNYIYYNLIVPKKNEINVFNYFKNLQFVPLTLETKNIFLYNNSVIINIDKIKRKWKNKVINELYNKCKNNKIIIKQFELQENAIAFKGQFIYNFKRKKCGVIHVAYKIPNKRNPYVLGFIWNNYNEKTSILKEGKNEILLKQFQLY